jgi:hypothetical protein
MVVYLIPLFFLVMELIFLFNYRKIYYYMQVLPSIWKHRTKGIRLVIVSRDVLFFLLHYIVRILYLIYCIYIVLFTPYWQPGCMLLFISSLTQMAVSFRISGLTTVDPRNGFAYPTRLYQSFMSGLTVFILSNFAFGALR